MDLMDSLIGMLRDKPAAPAKPAAPGPAVQGGAALADPAYAAYVREARSMGEPVMTREQFHASGSK